MFSVTFKGTAAEIGKHINGGYVASKLKLTLAAHLAMFAADDVLAVTVAGEKWAGNVFDIAAAKVESQTTKKKKAE